MTALPASLRALQSQFADVAREHIAPHAAEVDRRAQWPEHAFTALKRAGLMGLHVPRTAGGLEEGLWALAIATEAIGRHCASSAICYGMHAIGTAVIAAKATPYHVERFLKPIAAGEHITTLSLSEAGSGAHFYLPETKLSRVQNGYRLHGTKQFVTNASYADSYVVTTKASEDSETGDFSCVVVEKDTAGMEWLAPWDGFGMRGNSARGLQLSDVNIPAENLLGQEGDHTWYVFEVVAPYFLIAMAGTYLGVAQAALDSAQAHLKSRVHSSTGETLAAVESNQAAFADLWLRVERTRLWIYHAAQLGDYGDPNALQFLLGAKLQAAETAVHVTNEAMTLGGGIAYRENSDLARYLRDARASHVMTPTSAILRLWLGRALLGQPLL